LPVPSELGRLRVVLVRTRNPLNIGASGRAMSNFGFLHLRVVKPYAPAFREARSAVGAASLLAEAEEFETVTEAVADCSLVVGTTAVGQRELRQQFTPLREGADEIREHLAMGKVALLFGSEKTGLSNQDLAHCHKVLHIPTREEHQSMNLGQAVAVCLYELARGTTVRAVSKESIPSSAAQLERIAGVLLEALRASGYVASGAAAVEGKVQLLLHRINLEKSDAELFLGMLRQILWKLRQNQEAAERDASRRARS